MNWSDCVNCWYLPRALGHSCFFLVEAVMLQDLERYLSLKLYIFNIKKWKVLLCKYVLEVITQTYLYSRVQTWMEHYMYAKSLNHAPLFNFFSVMFSKDCNRLVSLYTSWRHFSLSLVFPGLEIQLNFNAVERIQIKCKTYALRISVLKILTAYQKNNLEHRHLKWCSLELTDEGVIILTPQHRT